MPKKIVFPAIYGLIFYEKKLLLKKLSSGPEKDKYCLPYTKVIHGQDHRLSFTNSILENYSINKFNIENLFSVITHIYNYNIDGEDISQHILGIIYKCISIDKPIIELKLKKIKDLIQPENIIIDILQYKNHNITPFAAIVIEKYLSNQKKKDVTRRSRTNLSHSIY